MTLTSPCFYPESFDHPLTQAGLLTLLTPEAFPSAWGWQWPGFRST